MSISIRKQFESKVLTHLTKKFKGDISSALTLAVILNKTDNSLIFQCEDKIQNYQEYEVKLQNEFEDEDLLIEQAKQIFDRLIIDINIIREVTQEEEKAVKIIQKHAKNEVLIKKQFFSLRLNDDNGDIQLVQGECHIIRKMDNDSIDDPNARLTEQQKIKIGRLNKQQMQHLFANFQTLINSNITILQENLAFEDINMFLNPQSIQISRISFQ